MAAHGARHGREVRRAEVDPEIGEARAALLQLDEPEALVDEHDDFDPVQRFSLKLSAAELTPEECEAAGLARSVDDIELDLSSSRGTDPTDGA